MIFHKLDNVKSLKKNNLKDQFKINDHNNIIFKNQFEKNNYSHHIDN